jgi:hypothetical protein
VNVESDKNGTLVQVAQESKGKDLNVAGLTQLRVFEKELGKFYKELICVVLMDPVDAEAAKGLERRVNDLILTVSDSIHEVELQVMATE